MRKIELKKKWEQNMQKTNVKERESVGGYKGTWAEERRNEGRSKEGKVKKNQEEEFEGTRKKERRRG